MYLIKVIEKGGSKKLTQWDVDRHIKIVVPEGIGVSHVDFAHEHDLKSIRREIILSDGIMTAKIPNSLLQRCGKMRLWLVYDDVTIFGDILVVAPKTQDPGYVLPDDEDDVYNYTSLEKRISDLEKNSTGGTPDAVQYVPQTLTEEQKAQARKNIGAVTINDVNFKVTVTYNSSTNTLSANKTFAEILTACLNGKNVYAVLGTQIYMLQYINATRSLIFESILPQQEHMLMYTLVINADNTVSQYMIPVRHTIDAALSEESENAVQNKVVTAKFNEVSKEIANLKQNGGDVDVDAELREYYTTAKSAIRNSIEYKGVTVSDEDSLNDYAERIMEIPSAVEPTETLPSQTMLFAQALQEEFGIKLSWNDVGAAGYLLVRKAYEIPRSTADGAKVYKGNTLEVVDVDVEHDVTYYYRIFPYNDLEQYQAEEANSIVGVTYVDRSGQIPLSELAVGDAIKFGEYEGVLLTWKVVDTQEKAKGWLTVCCDQNLGTMAFDAPEKSTDNPNPVTARYNNGNNRWLYSNARQIMNSEAAKGEWYAAQHDYDVAPNYATTKNGFLLDFTEYEKNVIVPKVNKCILDTNDGGGSETMIDKIWLASSYAVGLEVFQPLEDENVYEYFVDNTSRSYASNWWLRTISGTSSASSVRLVLSNGSLYNGSASSNVALRPFCLLPTSAYMQWSDSDSAYTFVDDGQRNA